MKRRDTTPAEPEVFEGVIRPEPDEPERQDEREPSEIARESAVDEDEDGLPDRPAKHRVPS